MMNEAPNAAFAAIRMEPLLVDFDASLSSDDQGIVSYLWDFGDGSTGEGMRAAHTFESPGCYEVRLEVQDAEGLSDRDEQVIRVIEVVGSEDPPLMLEGLPSDGGFLARDLESNAGVVTIEGAVEDVGFESIIGRVYVGERLEQEVEADLCGERFSLALQIPAELESRRIEVGVRGIGMERVVAEVSDLVAGDVFLINGQSNAVANEFSGSAEENASPFLRSFGSRTENQNTHRRDGSWHQAASVGVQGAVGQWGIRMAAQLSARWEIPIAVINGARGGRPIGYFQRNDEMPRQLATNYGRLLDRTERSGASGSIRAILFYQGESDGANAEAHRDGFTALHEDWRLDYPEVEHFYVTQVRRGCGGQLVTREVQRRFAGELEGVTLMSTTGLDGHDGCHFAYAEGYRELGDRYANLLSRDLYGDDEAVNVEAVDVARARLDGERQIIIDTESDATGLIADEGVEAFFVLPGSSRRVEGVAIRDGDQLVLSLSEGSEVTQVGFDGHPRSGPWVTNVERVGLLAFLVDVSP